MHDPAPAVAVQTGTTPVAAGKTEVLWLGQATTRITTPGGKVIVIDPWLKTNPKTPANWKDGEDCIITPAVNNDEAKTLFPKGFTVVKPYLRYTPQPNK